MERYEVILQPFSEDLGLGDEYSCPNCKGTVTVTRKLPDGGVESTCKKCGNSYASEDPSVEFICFNCKESVKATKQVQKELAVGGVGHKCKNCDTYYAVVQCPACKNTVVFDDKEWNLLANYEEGCKCPTCNCVLYRKKKDWINNYESIVPYRPQLLCRLSSPIENSYISKIKSNFDSNHQEKIAVRHHAVWVRIKSSKNSMEFLVNEEWYSQYLLVNYPGHVHEYYNKQKIRTPFDHEFHDNLFGFINNLTSSLDMLAQEVVSIYLPNEPERDIYYKSFCKKLTNNEKPIKELINSFKGRHTFKYLDQLRNILQHNRIPMFISTGMLEGVQLDSIRPVTVRSLANVYLPKNPFEDTDKLQVANGVELFGFLKRVYGEIESHIIEVYEKIDQLLSDEQTSVSND